MSSTASFAEITVHRIRLRRERDRGRARLYRRRRWELRRRVYTREAGCLATRLNAVLERQLKAGEEWER
jgi:hypothetical protein